MFLPLQTGRSFGGLEDGDAVGHGRAANVEDNPDIGFSGLDANRFADQLLVRQGVH